MKKLMALLLAVVMVLGLAACGEQKTKTPENGEEEQQSGKDYEIVVIAKNAESTWGIRQELGVKWFADETGINAYQVGPSSVDASVQLQLLEDAIAQGVDAICIVPVDVESVESALQRAREQGIIVIANEGTAVVNKDYSLDAFNNDAFGEFMMESLASQMGGSGEYTTMVGSLSNGSHSIWQNAGVAYATEKYPDMTLLADDPRVESNDDTEKAYEKTKELLKKYPDLKGIVGASSADLPGIAKALEELDKVNTVFAAGLGTPNKCRQFLESGTLKETCTWDPAGAGYAMCSLALKILQGETVQNGMDLGIDGYHSITFSADSDNCLEGAGMITITKDNVNDYDF